MSILKQEAVKLIEDIQEDAMIQVIAFLQSFVYKPEPHASLEGFQTLQSFAGRLPEDFDYKTELEKVREEKHDRLN